MLISYLIIYFAIPYRPHSLLFFIRRVLLLFPCLLHDHDDYDRDHDQDRDPDKDAQSQRTRTESAKPAFLLFLLLLGLLRRGIFPSFSSSKTPPKYSFSIARQKPRIKKLRVANSSQFLTFQRRFCDAPPYFLSKSTAVANSSQFLTFQRRFCDAPPFSLSKSTAVANSSQFLTFQRRFCDGSTPPKKIRVESPFLRIHTQFQTFCLKKLT